MARHGCVSHLIRPALFDALSTSPPTRIIHHPSSHMPIRFPSIQRHAFSEWASIENGFHPGGVSPQSVRFSLVDVAASLMKVSKEEFVQAEGPEDVLHREIV